MKRILLFMVIFIVSFGTLLSLSSCEESNTGDDICNIGDIQNGGCD